LKDVIFVVNYIKQDCLIGHKNALHAYTKYGIKTMHSVLQFNKS